MASDIQACQDRGKIVTLSMGGATGAAVFTSDEQAESFAELVWDLFLGGSSDTRPFGMVECSCPASLLIQIWLCR